MTRSCALAALALLGLLAAGSRAADEVAAEPSQAKLDELRETFPTLLKNYLAEVGATAMSFTIVDPATNKEVVVRLLKPNPKSLRLVDGGGYEEDILVADRRGKSLTATASIDVANSDWKVTRVQVRRPPKQVRPRDDAQRLVDEAVMRAIDEAVKRDGGFAVRDEEVGKSRRLKLRAIPNERVVATPDGRYRACAYFTDLDDGAPVDVDFLASLEGKSARVFRIVLHQVSGQLRPDYGGAH
jgi:hypothetical protein